MFFKKVFRLTIHEHLYRSLREHHYIRLCTYITLTILARFNINMIFVFTSVSSCVSINECANQTYNVEIGATAVVRCGYNSSVDYPYWSFTFPNGTYYHVNDRVNEGDLFNPNLPGFGRMSLVDRRHLEIRSLTKAEQGIYQCTARGVSPWSVKLTPIGNCN